MAPNAVSMLEPMSILDDDSSLSSCITVIKTKTTGRKKNKSVSFSPKCKGMFVTHIKDMSEEEINSIWYTKTECKQFKKEIHTTLEMAREGKLKGQEQFCDRGLEHVIYRKVGTLRSQRRRKAIETVLLEQFEQKREGHCSPDFIAELYEDVTAQSQINAHEMALKDAADALSYMQEQSSRDFFVKTPCILEKSTETAGKSFDIQMARSRLVKRMGMRKLLSTAA